MDTEQNGQIFRTKSLNRICSPEDLSDYVRVANPGVWMILSAVIILLAGIIVWGVFGRIDTKVDAVCLTEDGRTVCFVSEKYITRIHEGMEVTLSTGEKCTVDGISAEAKRADDVLSDYIMHLGEFDEGEWIHALSIKSDSELPGGSTGATVTIESIHPMKFILN